MNWGSAWRRWDLHIHTPVSFAHNFKFKSEDSAKYKDPWEKYVSELEKVNWISVIGITDYFSIEGYNKILEYVDSGRLNNFSLILPNIEFRLDKFVVEDKKVNFHVIFSNEVDPKDIEREFLTVLKITTPTVEERTLTRMNIESIGKKLKQQHKQFSDRNDYEVGCMNIEVSLQDIVGTLEKRKELFQNKYLLVVAERGWDKIGWDGQGHLYIGYIKMRKGKGFGGKP